jgi:hypothetical protein
VRFSAFSAFKIMRFSAESPKIVRFSAKHIIFASLLKWMNGPCIYDDVLVAKRKETADSFLHFGYIQKIRVSFTSERLTASESGFINNTISRIKLFLAHAKRQRGAKDFINR